MTVTTPVNDLLAIARRYETEQRFAQAAAAYQEALDNMSAANGLNAAEDRLLIEGMKRACISRSQEMVSLVFTSLTEEAKAAIDKQGERMAEKRALALRGGRDSS